MSLVKMLLSGLLVAGGLILGAFTLHGFLDPQWAHKQMQAARQPERAPNTPSINAFNRSRFVATRSEAESPTAKATAVKAPAKSHAAPVDAKAAAKPAAKKSVAEKPADKTKKTQPQAQPQPQQASFQWPWLNSLFGSN
jgi:hypothetical protein